MNVNYSRKEVLELLHDASNQDYCHNESRKYSHESICAVQYVLGLNQDGVIGFETSIALSLFQKKFKAQFIDGMIGPETFLLLYNAFRLKEIPTGQNFKKELNKKIKCLERDSTQNGKNQIALFYNRKRRFSKPTIKVIQRIIGVSEDGIIGFETVKAVRKWQSKHGLIEDGKVGIETLKVMGFPQ